MRSENSQIKMDFIGSDPDTIEKTSGSAGLIMKIIEILSEAEDFLQKP